MAKRPTKPAAHSWATYHLKGPPNQRDRLIAHRRD
jgi:hypothetical protein